MKDMKLMKGTGLNDFSIKVINCASKFIKHSALDTCFPAGMDIALAVASFQNGHQNAVAMDGMVHIQITQNSFC